MKYVMQGGIWKVPTDYMESADAFDVTLRHAVGWCLKFEPFERPSAPEVANYLRKAREQYKVNETTLYR